MGHETSRMSTPEVGSPGGIGVYNDMIGAISQARLPAANAPSWESITLDGITVDILAFDTGDKIPLFVQTEHGVALEQVIGNHIHWTMAANDAGDEFQFQITGVGAGIGELFQSIGTIKSGDYTLTGNEATRHNYMDIGDIPALNTTVSSVFIIIVERIAPDDGNDTAEKIYVFFNDSHPIFDQIGSRTETVK